jgi:hypothetical protein
MARTLFTLTRTCGAVLGLALLLGCGGYALREWVLRDDHRAVPLTAAPLGLGGKVPDDLTGAVSEQIAAIYDGVFHATVYYTPRESAFNTSAGFDMTPGTKPGLKGKSFPRDFLKAVELEGFGRMKAAVDGKWYVSCCRGCWDFAEVPLDSNGRPLRALRSTAVGADYERVRSQASFRVRAPGMPASFLEARWQVCDTGAGLKPGQIDFYWGEDAPMGPGAKLSRPQGMPHPIANPVVLVLR